MRISHAQFQLSALEWISVHSVPGEVVSNTGKHKQSNFRRGRSAHFCESGCRAAFYIMENEMNGNAMVDFYGILNLLRQLIGKGHLSKREAERIAARIAKQTGVFLEFSL